MLSISVSSNVVYPLLEQKCIDGTRAESKYAITAIASLLSPDDQRFAKLCKVMVVQALLVICYFLFCSGFS
jgi:sister-chromatid-cohesion protein PDS5